MLDALQNYLTDAASPQLVTVLTNAQNLFDRLGMEAHDEAFLELLMADDEADAGETLAGVIALTDRLLVAVLGQHGILVADEATTQQMVDLVRVLLDIPGWEDQHGLLVVAQQPKATIERLAELVEVVNGAPAETVMPTLDSASATLLTKIASLCAQNLIDEDEEDVLGFRQSRLDAYRAFVDQQMLKDTLIQTLIANGMTAGYPFKLYVDQIGRDIESLPALGAAQELVGMALLSSDGYTHPDAAIGPQLEFLIADPDQRTKVHVATRDLIFKLSAE
jgi:hypothetical protein